MVEQVTESRKPWSLGKTGSQGLDARAASYAVQAEDEEDEWDRVSLEGQGEMYSRWAEHIRNSLPDDVATARSALGLAEEKLRRARNKYAHPSRIAGMLRTKRRNAKLFGAILDAEEARDEAWGNLERLSMEQLAQMAVEDRAK